MFRQYILVKGWFDHEGLNDLTSKPYLSVTFFVAMILWHTCEVESIGKSLPIVKEIAHLPPLRLSPVFFSLPPDFSPIDLNKEIQMYQGKAPDKSRAVFALSHSIMNEQEVPEEARSPGKPWFAHFFSLCPSYFKSFLNYPLILHLSDPGSFFSVTSALMLAFSSSGTFFLLST